jgi:UDP-2,4-diacetamido-2,4,6-trideoxy-beta-L-altropyranose hydrolase
MRVVIRTDASIKIGTGHVMRCLTLAEGFRGIGADITFVCREHDRNLCESVDQKNFTVYRLPIPLNQSSELDWNYHAAWLGVPWEQDANETLDILKTFDDVPDLIIVDHYALDYRWEGKLRSFAKKLMVIDDLADRFHNCDFLLDQNLYQNLESRYDKLVPEICHKFLGPRYALLRPEFAVNRVNTGTRTGKLKKIFVFMGGEDPTNETHKVLDALKNILIKDISISVVLGGSDKYQHNLKMKFQKTHNFVFFSNIANMAELMSESDLAIGGGGVTSWERCSLRLPAIIISLAENQVGIAKNLEMAGAAIYLGKSVNVSSDDISDTIVKLHGSPKVLKRMSQRAGSLIDGEGMRRVIERLQEL